MKKTISIAAIFLSFIGIATVPFFSGEEKELKEGTTSCDEVFGSSFGEIKFKKENKLQSLNQTHHAPKIGYQSALSQDGKKISIRYVAAIDSYEYDSAVWSRSLYDSNGDILNVLEKKTFEVTTTYTGITNGGVITYANEIEDEDGGHPYNRFVVYTLLDIPLEEYGNSYLDAKVSLIKDDTVIEKSKVGSLKVNQEDYFSYKEAKDSIVFNIDTENKCYSVLEDTSSDFVVIPKYYSDGDHRYIVNKIEDQAFKDKESATIVLPKSIEEIGKDSFSASSTICYMGSKEEWNNIRIHEESGIDSTLVKYYDKNLTYCNSFYINSLDEITYSSIDHMEDEAVIENVTATCTEAGAYDLVTYCACCGIELERETHAMDALGHNYIEYEEINSLGHSHTVHECDSCGDIYYDSLVVDYTKTYEYKTFTESDYYLNYRDDIKNICDNLYEGCMEVLNSTVDYSPNWNGNTRVLVASSTFTNLNSNQAWGIANFFMDNNPQFYFLSNSVYYGSNGVYLVLDEAYYTYASRKEINDKILDMEEDFTREFLKDESLTTDVLKAKFIHDYIASNLYYQNDENGDPSSESWAHNIVGFIDQDPNTGGVCECYAKVYLYLSRLVGINTITVVGYAGSGELGGHAWNYTEIDGAWYGVDVTWDDQGEIIYDFFLASKSKMENAGYYWDYATHMPSDSDLASYSRGASYQVLLPELAEETAYSI